MKNYTLETVVDGIPIPGMAWLPDGSMLVTEKFLYHVKTAKTEVKMFPQSIIAVKAVCSILSCILIMLKWLVYITYASTEGEESGNTKLIRAKLENESLIKYNHYTNVNPIQPRDSTLVPESF
jgi:hypothetical protein